MGGVVRTVKKVFKAVSPVLGPVIGLATGGAGFGFTGTLGSILSAGSKAFSVLSAFNTLSGKEKQTALKEDPEILAAQRRQEALLQQQNKAADRERQLVNQREQELGRQRASLRSAILARRSGRSNLRFTGPTTRLKNKLGNV